MGELMPHWLTKQALLAPDKIAIETLDGEKTTFTELEKHSKSYAKKLNHYGVLKGSHVALLSENSKEMIIAIHALSYLEAVVVLLNTRLTDSELSYQVKDADVKFILASNRFYNTNKKEVWNCNVVSFSEILTLNEKEIELATEIDLSTDFTIMYTSGTTGFPKGVVHTYGNHLWSAVGSALNFGLQPSDKWLVVLPLFHISGLSTLFKSVIYGMEIMVLKEFDERIINNIITENRITIISVVTFMMQKLINDLGDKKYPDHFRTMLLGGGPVAKSLLEKAAQKQIPVYQSYGMTETCSQISTLSPTDSLRKIGSAGKALFPAQLKIENQDKTGVGEIVVKGLMVTSTYYQNKKANEAAFKDKWLQTGDMGYLDEEKFLYLVDRRSDLIISGGENVYPSEVESVISELNYIEEVGVVGRKDKTWGEVPVAFVVCNEEGRTSEDIIKYTMLRLAKYKTPKSVFFVKKLPRNATNKLMRKKLLNLL